MKQLKALVKRNLKESVREPLSLVFCIGFPVVMLLVMQIIFKSIEFMPENFAIENYAMGICVFGYTFTSLFMAMSIAGDKNTAFIKRIAISPVSKMKYLFSYLISGIPITFCQTVLFLLISLVFDMKFDSNLILALFYLFPSAIFFISLGILLGVICANEKQTGPISSIIISLTSILGGIFMPISAFTGSIAKIVNGLPFVHSVQIASELYTVGASCIIPHLYYLIAYSLLLWGIIYLLEKARSKR